MEQKEQLFKKEEGNFVVRKPKEGYAVEKKVEKTGKDEAEAVLFADGLPDWDLIPPQVVVRRRKRA